MASFQPRQAQPGSCEAIAEEIKTALDLTDEGVVLKTTFFRLPKCSGRLCAELPRRDKAQRKKICIYFYQPAALVFIVRDTY